MSNGFSVEDYLSEMKRDIQADLERINKKLDTVKTATDQHEVKIGNTADGLQRHKESHWKFLTACIGITGLLVSIIIAAWR